MTPTRERPIPARLPWGAKNHPIRRLPTKAAAEPPSCTRSSRPLASMNVDPKPWLADVIARIVDQSDQIASTSCALELVSEPQLRPRPPDQSLCGRHITRRPPV